MALGPTCGQWRMNRESSPAPRSSRWPRLDCFPSSHGASRDQVVIPDSSPPPSGSRKPMAAQQDQRTWGTFFPAACCLSQAGVWTYTTTQQPLRLQSFPSMWVASPTERWQAVPLALQTREWWEEFGEKRTGERDFLTCIGYSGQTAD